MYNGLTRILTTIATWSNGMPEDDAEYIAESLMRTWDGSYYLYCEGGEMTFYSKFSDGVLVKAMSKAQAYEWAVEKGLVDQVEAWLKDVA